LRAYGDGRRVENKAAAESRVSLRPCAWANTTFADVNGGRESEQQKQSSPATESSERPSAQAGEYNTRGAGLLASLWRWTASRKQGGSRKQSIIASMRVGEYDVRGRKWRKIERTAETRQPGDREQRTPIRASGRIQHSRRGRAHGDGRRKPGGSRKKSVASMRVGQYDVRGRSRRRKIEQTAKRGRPPREASAHARTGVYNARVCGRGRSLTLRQIAKQQ